MKSLSEENIPAGVTVRLSFDAHDLSFANAPANLAPLGLGLMVVSWVALFAMGVPFAFYWTSQIRDVFLGVILIFWFFSWSLPLFAWLAGQSLAAKTIAKLSITPHHIEGTSTNQQALPRWTVHDLEEVWASHDHFSPIVAIRRRSGEVDALRVDTTTVATWLVRTLEEWRQTRGTEPDEQAEAMLRAVRERVGQVH